MKRPNLFTLALVGIVGLLVNNALAQTKGEKEEPSLLYKVTGKGISKPSYLFGTFHAICPTEMVPFAALDPYLDQTDQLLMEIDMDDQTEMMKMATGIMIPGGKTIKDYLKPEEFAKVDEMTQNLLGYSAENVKTVKPTILTVLLLTSAKAIGCTPTVYDTSLMQNAVAKKKPVVGLETVASQIEVIDSKPIEEQAKELSEMAADPQKAINQMKTLMAAYKSRDPEKLIEITNSQLKKDGDRAFEKRLLEDRNSAWIPKLEAAFKEKPTFVAFGAGHLGGKTGVLALLRAKGYQVTPVKL